MIEKTYEVIDEIESSDLNKTLLAIKEKIKNNNEAKKLVRNFNKAKENYEKHGDKNEFLIAKKALMENEVIRSYLHVQSEVNLLSAKINNRIKNLTNGVTCDK